MNYCINWREEARVYWSLFCEEQGIAPQIEDFKSEVSRFGPMEDIDTWRNATGHFVVLWSRWGNGCYFGAALRDLFCDHDFWFYQHPGLIFRSLMSLSDGQEFFTAGCYELMEIGAFDELSRLVQTVRAGLGLHSGAAKGEDGAMAAECEHPRDIESVGVIVQGCLDGIA